jgi:hypothetical protein
MWAVAPKAKKKYYPTLKIQDMLRSLTSEYDSRNPSLQHNKYYSHNKFLLCLSPRLEEIESRVDMTHQACPNMCTTRSS